MKIERGSFINDFIDKNLRQYSIPVYQRNYEWSAEQCEKLFDDILQAHRLDRYHFTGSVVYELLKTENKIEHYVIIDGQQRLTTIYILIKALIDVAETEGEKETLKSLMFNQDKFKKYDIDESSKLKLKPIKSDNKQLMLLMNDKQDRMDRLSGIYLNYVLFCNLVRRALNEDSDLSIERIYDGIEHLTCAVIKLEDEEKGQEQEIFEGINSTGVPLSLSDKIRNFVLMTDVDQDRLYEEYWLQIEQMLSKEQMQSFFLDYLNFKLDGFTREKEAYDDFKSIYLNNGFSNESMLSELKHYAGLYNTFLKGSTKLGINANKALDGLRRLNQSTVYLFLFYVFDDFEKAVINLEELEKILSFLLNYSVRRLVCEIGSNSLRGLYKTLYYRVFNRPENKEHYYDAIVSFLSQLTSKDAIPSDEEFSIALKEKNLYRKNAICKYLLVAIENQGKEKVETTSLSIEHIMPQNKNLSKDWQNMLGENWESVHDRYLHTLGNLTLTGYNSELGDRPFEEKKQLLENPDNPTHITVLYKDVLDCDIWNEEKIKTRAARLSDTVLKLFAIKPAETFVDFSDPRYAKYTAADPSNATYKIVNYYELLGEHINVDSFAVMTRSVASKLYDYEPSVIESIAKANEIWGGWEYPVFSYDIGAVKNPYEFRKGSGIYMSVGYSARDCVAIIRYLLTKYDLDIGEDFVYSARRPSANPTKTSWFETAKEWCEKKSDDGNLRFSRENCEKRYVRFTTEALNSILPMSPDGLSPWKTHNFYFYEITRYEEKLYIQLYLYCRGITSEMKEAFQKFSDIVENGGLGKGYKLFFKSTSFQVVGDESADRINEYIETLYSEVRQFENNVLRKWNQI